MDKTQKAIEVFDACAELYMHKFMDLPQFQASFDFFCSNIQPQHTKILELACGPGNITRYLLEKRPDFQIMATDLAPNMLALAKSNNPNAEFKLLDCRNVLALDQKFDAVMCGFALPYLSKEETAQLFKDLSKVVQPQGLVYFSTMEGDYAKSDWKGASHDPNLKTYTHYHEAEYLIKNLAQNGFHLIYEQRIESLNAAKEVSIDLILIAQKNDL